VIPTYAQVTAAARAHLGDTMLPAGSVWSDANGKLDPYVQQAYSELYKGFEGAGVENIVRTLYGIAPAYTSYISPASYGAVNFSEPTFKPLWESGVGKFASITSLTPITSFPIGVEAATPAHTFVDGEMVLIFGVDGYSDLINDIWSVENLNPAAFFLGGCPAIAEGSYSGNGKAITITQDWSEVVPLPDIQQWPTTPGGQLQRYEWVGNAFRVFPASVQRAIKMEFYLSGKSPDHTTPTVSMGFDDSLGFLAYRASGLAWQDRGGTDQAMKCNREALGPTGIHQDWGGLYGLLMRSKARSAARNRVVVGSFRNSRRNAGWIQRY
jgi:hypothetical protein